MTPLLSFAIVGLILLAGTVLERRLTSNAGWKALAEGDAPEVSRLPLAESFGQPHRTWVAALPSAVVAIQILSQPKVAAGGRWMPEPKPWFVGLARFADGETETFIGDPDVLVVRARAQQLADILGLEVNDQA